ncbi:uncharacterized protein PV07_03250 [Cladophialophora immunda]|uniref:Ig-like domain-containing protein n=1 Tax=Cladophialophora immunda TaxID=569365 RepID=A0A0D2D7C5_9EURO|nr:uncharacterized protein PV07_03250 [Cladophialophora immunda]KIW31624.1 hypothetical protein PV07_03250 [Cladophialophora immunda]
MAFLSKMGVIATTIMLSAITPSTAVAVPSTATTSGSYTLCQFYSSIPGLSSTQATSMTLPLCPSSLLTFSYTIPPETTTGPATTAPTDTPWPSPSTTTTTTAIASSLTLCQFYSSISGLPSQPTAPVSSMTLPSCPASLQDITYSYQAPLATDHVSATATAASATSATPATSTGAAAVAASSFTGAAAPRPDLDRMVIGGVGGILAGAVGMML